MTLKASMDRANPNTLADGFRLIKIGKTLASDVKQTKRKVDMDAAGADPGELATLDALVLPEDARAIHIFRAYARAGTAGTGEMTVAAPNATPTTGQIAVSPQGNIVALAADAITDVDIEYLAARGDVFELEGDVASGTLTLPSSLTNRGVVLLLSAVTDVGTKIILAPGGSPSAGQAALNTAKSTVEFAAGDGDATATVRLLLVPVDGEDNNALLESEANNLI